MVMDSKSISASSDMRLHWNQINWNRCDKNIKILQSRIVQATKEGRWNKVKTLQHLLTRSFSAKALAVKHVTTNRGKYTAGIDGQLWTTSTSKSQGIKALKQRGYKPQPLKRVCISKSDGGKRYLGIPTIKDRAMQSLYLMGLEPVAETTGDKDSYGFRKHRSTSDATSQIFCVLARKDAARWILEADIEKCFDEINHEWLINSIPMEKRMLKKWLNCGYMRKNIIYPTWKGTPQGGIISPVLANMALDGLEKLLSKHFGNKGSNKRKKSGVHLIRYADDFIVTGKTQEVLVTEAEPIIRKFLEIRGLRLSERKTKITHISEGFNFLGQTVRKYKEKFIIKPSNENVKRLLRRIRYLVKKNRASTQEEIINVLNPQIRGWTYYHRNVCARKTYEKVDHEIFKLLWRWSKRRHPNKGLRWIKEKYFKVKEGRQWCFSVKTQKKEQTQWIELFLATNVTIRRHIKVRNKSNPFDKDWFEYFVNRKKLRASY